MSHQHFSLTSHNIIRTRYWAVHQELPDEDNNHRQVPGAWRQGQILPDIGEPHRGNHDTITAKRLIEYLIH